MIKIQKEVPIVEAKRIFFDAYRYDDFKIAGCFRLVQAINGMTNNIMDDSLSIANIERVLNALKTEYYEIINLRFWQCYNLREIADKQGVTRENIRQKQKKALSEFKTKLVADRVGSEKETKERKADELKDLIPIEALMLSGRPYNALRRAGINTVNRLITLSKKQLLRIPNFGEWCIDEIETKLHQHYPGIKLVSDKEYLEGKIEALAFPTYIENVLKRQRIRNISDLVRLSDKQIKKIPGIGPKSLQVILSKKHELE